MRVADVLPVPTPLEPVDRPETVGAPAARRRGGLVGRINVVGWRVIALAAFLVVWHLASIPAGKLLLPSPLDIVPAFIDEVRSGQLVTATLSSLQVFAVGYLLAIVTGVAFGVLMGGMPRLGETLEIYVNALNATPRVALIPFIILWFGLGIWSKVLIVFLGAVFPLLVNTYEGVRNADRVLVNVVRSFGGSSWQVARIVVLPGALPYVVAGLRLAIGRAVLGVVVGEFFGASRGLGYMIASAASSYRPDVMFAGVLVLMALSLVLTFSVQAVEARLTRWRPEAAKTF